MRENMLNMNSECYDFEDDVHFKNDEFVNFIFDGEVLWGRVVGVCVTDCRRIWCIDIGYKYSQHHPYQVICVPQTLIVKEE